MPRNPRSFRLSRRRAGVLAVIGALAAAIGLAVAVPGSGAASASVRNATGPASSRVTCVKRPSVTPPPLGVVKAAAPGHGGQPVPTPHTLKPVCPLGKVPVINSSLSRPLTHGTARVMPGPRTSAAPACGGTFEYGSCYYWASAADARPDHGGGFTMTIEKPSVVKTGASHSLEEMSVQGGNNNGNIIEIGSIVVSGETDPQLFVFHWVNQAGTCYDGCGYQQYSNTYYPSMDLAALVGQSVYSGYVYYKGRWWAWFNGQWLGYFPASLWSGTFGSSQEVQWFGEVAADRFPPRSAMGNGHWAGNPAAAPMSTLCDVNVTAWRCYYYNQQSLFASDSKFYTIRNTGFGKIRLGGPGT